MRTLLPFVTAALLATSLIGCGSGAYCDRTSKCTNQPLRSDAQKKACNDDLTKAGSCKSQYEAWLNCQMDNEICAADGTSDPVATIAYATKPCQAAKDAYTSCVSPDAGK